MSPSKRLPSAVIAFLLLTLGFQLPAQSGDPAAILQKLNAQFKLTTTTADRTDIVTPGDVVVIQKPGLLMFDVASVVPPTNVYKDGRVGQGFGTQMMMTGKNRVMRRFVPGEKCWVTAVSVQNDGVSIGLYSDPYNDVRYYAVLKIPFPNKKEVPPADSVMGTIAEVLTVVPASGDQGGQGATPPPAQATAPAPIPPPPAACHRAPSAADRCASANHRLGRNQGPGDRGLWTAGARGQPGSETNLLLQGHEGDLHQWKGKQRGVGDCCAAGRPQDRGVPVAELVLRVTCSASLLYFPHSCRATSPTL